LILSSTRRLGEISKQSVYFISRIMTGSLASLSQFCPCWPLLLHLCKHRVTISSSISLFDLSRHGNVLHDQQIANYQIQIKLIHTTSANDSERPNPKLTEIATQRGKWLFLFTGRYRSWVPGRRRRAGRPAACAPPSRG
jgi:hypothetical protein